MQVTNSLNVNSFNQKLLKVKEVKLLTFYRRYYNFQICPNCDKTLF